eukprot:gnl/TRDRNA2_/TRDRNA2_188495_c0_seq1.p1 gnl/TRDRNA2_/TRDRNA2_188495_c0~~gnl/TRDRNA2_/TRDRNA2_188495_c0_seq1.p1  ORF type:complete len:566 (+),score=162.30 gnl/TRDRNA2_/TRDRNA2_188495_c0_seq1:229-1698(+)
MASKHMNAKRKAQIWAQLMNKRAQRVQTTVGAEKEKWRKQTRLAQQKMSKFLKIAELTAKMEARSRNEARRMSGEWSGDSTSGEGAQSEPSQVSKAMSAFEEAHHVATKMNTHAQNQAKLWSQYAAKHMDVAAKGDAELKDEHAQRGEAALKRAEAWSKRAQTAAAMQKMAREEALKAGTEAEAHVAQWTGQSSEDTEETESGARAARVRLAAQKKAAAYTKKAIQYKERGESYAKVDEQLKMADQWAWLAHAASEKLQAKRNVVGARTGQAGTAKYVAELKKAEERTKMAAAVKRRAQGKAWAWEKSAAAVKKASAKASAKSMAEAWSKLAIEAKMEEQAEAVFAANMKAKTIKRLTKEKATSKSGRLIRTASHAKSSQRTVAVRKKALAKRVEALRRPSADGIQAMKRQKGSQLRPTADFAPRPTADDEVGARDRAHVAAGAAASDVIRDRYGHAHPRFISPLLRDEEDGREHLISEQTSHADDEDH